MNQELQYRQKLEAYFSSKEDRLLLEKVLEHAAYLYEGLFRYSGESYFLRCLRLAADKILKYHPDKATVMATILVSACYSERCDLTEIEKLFGKDIRFLVETLGKINAIKSRYSASDTRTISKMLLTLAQDFRVILVRLAERIENLETLQFKGLEKQKANAREILEVYVPIAARLGLYEFRLQLEDLAFKYVYPQEFDSIKRDVDDYLAKSKQNIEEIKSELKAFLAGNGFEVKVSGRFKNLYSIYKKLKKKVATISEIYDVFAYRIIVFTSGDGIVDKKEDLEKLYAILSLLHKKYQYLPDRFKDYVISPKDNGYQSLHTALVGLDRGDMKKPVEIQIRTDKMHRFSEDGNASHWLYKESKNQPMDENLMRALNDLKANKIKDERTTALKIDLYPDRIFALTPDNLAKELPLGATPVDFAYSVHSDLGNSCYLAKVNGQVVPLDYSLKSGDVVEIVTGRKKEPKLSWLSFVKTRLAKNRIKNFFRGMDDEDLINLGKERFNELLARLEFPLLDEDLNYFKKYQQNELSLKDRVLILKEIGSGKMTVSQVFKDINNVSVDSFLKKKKAENSRITAIKSILPKSKIGAGDGSNQLIIGGEKNMPYRLSSCCKAKLTDEILAYLTRSKGISIHKKNCKFVRSVSAGGRILEAYLKGSRTEENTDSKKFQVSLLIGYKRRTGLISDLVSYLNRNKIKVVSMAGVSKKTDKEVKRLVVEVGDENELSRVSKDLGNLSGVEKVTRV